MKIKLQNHGSTTTLFFLVAIAFLNIPGNVFAQVSASATPDLSSILNYYNKQIYFTENAGQFSEAVKYRADFPMGQAVATSRGMIISTFDPETMNARQEEGEQIEEDIKNGKPWRPLSSHLKGHAWMMNFQNSSAAMNIEVQDAHSDIANYMTSSGQHSNVNSYAEVWYRNVYNQVDVRYYPSKEASLEYDIICKPGFDKNKIAIRFDGIERMMVAENGHLIMHTSVGDVDFPAPVVYQRIDGVEKAVVAKYVVTDNNVLSFQLGAFDASQALVIDPIALRWATWVNTNSSGDNHGHCIWVDPSDGAIYMVARVVGTTDQITPGAFDTGANGNLEMIVGKYLEPATIGLSGTRVWQTYIGGAGDDNPYAMEQGPDGNLYITGYTSSSDFPLIGGSAFTGGGASIDQRSQTTDNIFILKINQLGNSIKSSVIGGNGDDGSFDLRINESGDIVICGNTQSTNLLTLYPGTGASNTNNGNIDAIVFKINADLSSIAWIKNYGGSGIDQPTIMLQDITSGDIFVGGYTTSSNFPVSGNARQSTLGGTQSGFIQKLSSTGATRWSSYFQSAASKSSAILCMEFNTLKTQLYFGGITGGLAAANISGGLYTTYGGGTNDFFVCRMDTSQNFVASTYIGGSSNEVNMMGLNTDLNNDVYVFGYTNSTNFPVTALPNTPLQTTNFGSNDKVFLKLNSTLSTLNFSTYYGGSGDDYDPVGERGIKFSNCRIYTIVTSKSNNIPLTVGGPNVTRISTTPYEPGLVVWANPPDLAGNTINDDQTICYGAIPNDLLGSVPSYVLPTISRNGVNSAYPALGSAATYQWQKSIDNGANWTNIPGATGQNLLGTDIGQVFVNTIFRRIIGGDACILPNAADQTVTVTIITVTASNITPVSCTGGSNGSITASTDGTNPTYLWSTGATTQTISGLTAGSYTVTVSSNNGCSTSGTFTVTEPNSLPSVTITPVDPTCVGGGSNGSACANPGGGTGAFTYLWSTSATTQCATSLGAGSYTVTVTDANGCTASNSISLTLPSSPTTAISGNLSFCSGSSTQLCADGGFAGYLWNTGATTQCVTLSAAGSWTVTVTDANGCTGSASASTSENQNPNPSITGNGSICDGSSTQWCAPAGFASYLWSTGATTQCITVSSANTFTVTVTDANGCTGSGSKTLAVNQNPNPSITGNGSICDGSSTQWCAPAGFASYLWSTGATTQCITVSSANTFTVTVTDQNGCTGSGSKTLTVNQNPNPSITGNGSICDGSSTQWCAPAGFASYLWSTGATTQCITVSSANTFTVTVTDQNGCTGSGSKTLTLNQNPSPSITGNGSICSGSSTQWCAPAGFASYLWSTGATTQCITVSSANTFTVTVTDQNGCTGSGSKTLTLNQNPNPSITGNGSICSGSSTQWCAPAGFASYLWSTGATTQCITVSSANTFTVTVTDANGCTGSGSKTLTVNQNPNPSITGNGSICDGSSTQWCAPGGFSSYLWSTGATTQCITVSSANTFTVTVTDANGCTGSGSKTLTLNQNPNPSITGNGSICDGSSTQWCAPAGFASYLWSTGATTQCIVVSSANTYTVTVTDQNGCTGSGSKTLTINQNPIISITGNGSICDGSSTQWCAPGGFASYLWSTGATTQCIVVSSASTYTVTVTDGSGCNGSGSKTLSINQNPAPSITGNGSICDGSSTQWCAPAGFASYLWSTGATTQCITVSSANTFTVTVTDANGCTGSGSKTLTLNQNPNPSITGNGSICDGSSTQWCAPGGFASYLWSTGATTQCITVSSASTYTVTVTDANGCTGSGSKTLTLNQNPSPSITGNGSICDGSSTQWCAPSGFSSYLWSTGATTQCIVVSSASTYTVTVTDANGCTGSGSKTLTINQNPTISITGNASICSASSTQWCAPSGFASYLWSTGATTQCIVVNSANTYTVTVTDGSGCIGSGSKALSINQNPSPSITGNGSICDGSSTQWCAPGGFASYLWSTGATTQCIFVSSASTYTVTVTDANGCTGSGSKTLTLNQNPSPSISGNLSFCAGSSTQLCAPAGFASYLWSTGATTQCITVGSANVWSVTVTDANGCTGTGTATTTVNQLPACAISGNSSVCSGGSTQWCAPAGMASYLWSTGATTQCITVSAANTYSVTITDGNGCSSTCSKTLTVNQTATCVITGNSSVCSGGSTQWCAPAGQASYLWSTGATTQCITVSTANTYTVTTVDGNGCTSTCSKSLTVNSLPTCTITGNSSVCAGGSTQWCAAAGMASYLWSTGATTQCITVSAANTYSVTITNANGCTSTCSKSLTVNQTTTCVITGNSSVCAGGSTQWCAPAGMASYLWSTGATTQCITVSAANTYSVSTVDANGCTSTCSKTLTVGSGLNCSITGNGSICAGGSTQLCATAGAAAYLWSNGATTQCITVTAAGTYSVTVTSQAGCTSTCNKCVTVSGGPSCTISVAGCGNNNTICQGGTASLCAPSGIGYSYVWSTGATTRCINVNAAGTYSVTVTNNAGCSSTCSKTIYVSPAPSCNITVTGCGNNNTICQGQTATLCAPYGNGYTYTWSNGSHSRCINVTAAGTYTVTVTNSAGCSSTCSKTIYVSPAPSCNITVSGCGNNNTICQGGTASLCAPSGNGYTYTWSNGSHSRCINVTTAGTYTVTVTNASGCSSTCSKTIYVSPAPSCNITVSGCGNNNTICQGGTASLCAPSGIGYTYTWSNGSHSRCINVTAAGTYTVTVTNSSGCSSTCSKTIYVSTTPSCNITVSGCGNNNTICQGQTASLCAPSGNGYTYTWSTGSHSRCINVTTGGTYTVTVTNAGGCSSTCSKTITVNPRPSCTISGNTVIQQGQCTQLCAPSGIGNTYTWSNGSHSRCITVNCAGTYSVTVTNSSGCSSSCSVCVTVIRIHCRFIHNPDEGTLTAVGEEGKAPYSYVWHTETGETTPTINVKSSGEYAVTITDADGATVTEKYTLSLPGIEASVYPNPFVSSTTIQFRSFNKASNHAVVEIYAVDGSKVTTLFDGEIESGKNYMVKWNAEAREGIYMYRIICGEQVETGRMMLIREE